MLLTGSPWDGCECPGWRQIQASLHASMPPFPFFEMPLCIHLSFFTFFCPESASSIALPTTSSSSAQSLSFTFTLHYHLVFVVISMPFHFPQRSRCPLATNFLKSALPIPLRDTDAWMAEQVRCPGLFHQSRLRL